MAQPHKAYLNWSSGKDAAMALTAMQASGNYTVEKLLTTVNKTYERVTMHGLRMSLLQAQAKAIGIPLTTLQLSENPGMDEYNNQMLAKTKALANEGFTHSVFGDIFLEDLRTYREQMLQPTGIEPVFPLWKKNTTDLLKHFIATGFKAIVISCNAALLPKHFCGRMIDEQFINDLPNGIDPCGENGEFHTFCFAAPCFKYEVPFTKGEIVHKTYPAPNSSSNEITGYWYCDLLP